MASLLKQAIKDIIQQAATIAPFDEFSRAFSNRAFQFIAVYNDHFERIQDENEGYNFQLPCFFVEIIDQEYAPLALGITQADIIFRLHIGVQQLDAGDGTLDQNLDVFDYRDAVKVAFTDFQPKNCTPMFKVNEQQDYAHGNVYHYITDFKTGFIDTKGSPLDPDSSKWQDFTASDLEINAEYVDKIE